MTFLAPLPAIIAAGIAVPALVAMYLLKLRRKPVRISSTLLWDQAVQDLQANVPFRWLRPSWLLLLHLLILAALLLALARPAIDAGLSAAERVFLVLDRSASMSAAHADAGTRFERAIRDAGAFLDELEADGFAGSVTLIESAAEASIVEGPTPDLARIRSALGSLSPTDQPGRLAEPLQLAEALALAGTSESDTAPPSLVALFSDGVAPDASSLTLAGAEIRFVPAAGDQPFDNAGIAALSAQRDFADPVILRVFAQLVSTRAEPVGRSVAVRINGDPIDQTAVTIPPRDPETAEPGRRAITFELVHPGDGVLTLDLGQPDDLAADDTASLVLTPAQRPRVLLVRPSLRDPSRPNWVLDDPLAELDLAALERTDAAAYNAGPAAALRDIDLVLFDGVTPERLPPVPSISFGAGLPAPGLALTGEQGPARIISWERDHPLMRSIALDRLAIARTPTVDLEGSPVALARSERGPVIVYDDADGIGRLVVAFDPAQSDWPLDFGFAVFVARAIDTLAGRGEASSMRGVSTADPLALSPRPGSDRLRVTAPDGSVPVDLGPERLADRGRVPIGRLEAAGVYRVSGAREPAIALGLFSEIESAGAPRDAIEVGGRPVDARSGVATRPTEVWHWFILAAAILLALEWIVYAFRMRV
ncbi:MAG: VWA domain-containing protein [Phycisphaerales bacterium JB037]